MSLLKDMTDAGPRWLECGKPANCHAAEQRDKLRGTVLLRSVDEVARNGEPASAFIATRRGGRGVRIVELSNHPGVKLEETRQRRAHAEKHVRSQSEEARDQHLERRSEERRVGKECRSRG